MYQNMQEKAKEHGGNKQAVVRSINDGHVGKTIGNSEYQKQDLKTKGIIML